MKPVVFVDIDGVMLDSMPWWLKLYNKDNGTNYTVNDITEYDVNNILPRPLSYYYRDYRGVGLVDGAHNAVIDLSAFYRIVFVTAGYGASWLQEKIKKYNDFIFCPDRSLLRGYALIDDKPENLDVFEGVRYLLRQPWNTGRGLNDVTWKEIVEHLREAV